MSAKVSYFSWIPLIENRFSADLLLFMYLKIAQHKFKKATHTTVVPLGVPGGIIVVKTTPDEAIVYQDLGLMSLFRSEGRGVLVGIQLIISLTHNSLWLPSNRLTDDVPEGDLV